MNLQKVGPHREVEALPLQVSSEASGSPGGRNVGHTERKPGTGKVREFQTV